MNIANIYPVTYRNALHYAGLRGDIEEIDRLTDELARMGYCRKRSDDATQFSAPMQVSQQ